MAKPERWIDISYCDICKKETTQTFYCAGHERDSSNDYQKCHECGGIRFGLFGEWYL